MPEAIITNDDLAKIIDTSDEWITTRTGIHQRHISNGEPAWHMGAMAAERAIEAAGITAAEIDLIIFATVTAEFAFPSSSCLVQRELGVTGCMAIDVGAACSGFIYGLDMARRYLATGDVKKVLVIGAEELSRYVDFTDRASCILFGDGAGAVVVEGGEGFYTSFLGADGNGAEALYARHSKNPHNPLTQDVTFEDSMPPGGKDHLIQNGKEVYKFATRILAYAVNEALAKTDIKPDDIDLYIPHQANIRIINTAAANLGIPMERFYVNIERYGNTSSASIPIALDEAVRNGTVKRGDKLCLVGFGAGLTYGTVIFDF